MSRPPTRRRAGQRGLVGPHRLNIGRCLRLPSVQPPSRGTGKCEASMTQSLDQLASGAFGARCRVLLVLSLASCIFIATLGCRLEAPLAPTPSPSAALVTFVVGCGRWTPAGASCTARGVYSDRGERDLTSESQWESSDASVATVIVGRVTFISAGEVTVRAGYQSSTASARLSTTHAGLP